MTVQTKHFVKSPDVISSRVKNIMHIKEPFKPRSKLKGEVSPPTFNHLKDGQVYKSDWDTPVRSGAVDHLNVKSKGDSV
jgi:hypothetical protein